MSSMSSDINWCWKCISPTQTCGHAATFSTVRYNFHDLGRIVSSHSDDLASKIRPLDGWAFTCDPQLYEYGTMFEVNNINSTCSQQVLRSCCLFDQVSFKISVSCDYCCVPFVSLHQLASPPGFNSSHPEGEPCIICISN